jgi:hypothetical protein
MSPEQFKALFNEFTKDEAAFDALWKDISRVIAIHLCYWDEHHKPLLHCYARVDIESNYINNQ